MNHLCLLESMTVAKKMDCSNKLKPRGTPKFMGCRGGVHLIKLRTLLGRGNISNK